MRAAAITGASGFVGGRLKAALRERGVEIVEVSLRPEALESGGLDPAVFERVDAVFHLAGETIAGRWTAEKKRAIFDSRVGGTRALVAALEKCTKRPSLLISASAVGYYGSRRDESLLEASAPGTDFLASVCAAWEREAMAARWLGMRVVTIRTGIALGDGGALSPMRAPFLAGAGGPFGSGSQFVPWIHVDDLAAIYLHAAQNESVAGPVNAVAPDYATSARFSQALGAALGRPALLPAPPFGLRLILGEFADTLLASQLTIPAVLEDSGFVWKHPELEPALRSIFDQAPNRKSERYFAREQVVGGNVEDVFAFFAAASNLERITPATLRFAMLSKPPRMERGAQIAYRLNLRGLPIRWKTLISRWDPPFAFEDVQLHGPYALWRHRHTFRPVDGGVAIGDDVRYVLPFAPIGTIASGLVQRDIQSIFDFRREQIAQRFGSAART